MKVLITGCTGLLGANACYLLRDQHEIVGLARSALKMNNVRALQGDFSNYESMAMLFDAEGFDLVIHCAAMTNVDECERDPDLARKINAEATIDLASLASDYGSRFIFISTDAVFAGDSPTPYKESDATSPLSVYGRTKVAAEEGVLSKSDALVIRTNMYGFNYQNKQSLSEWVISSLEGNEEIKMFDDVIFNPLFVNTLVDAIGNAALGSETGILHLGNSTPVSKYDFGITIAKAFGVADHIDPISVDDFGFTAKRSHFMHLDCEKAQSRGILLPSLQDDVNAMVVCRKNGYSDRLKGGN